METYFALLAICAGIHRSPVNSTHKGQWRGAWMFPPLICAWINGWANNSEAGDLRRHRTHYDVTVMYSPLLVWGSYAMTYFFSHMIYFYILLFFYASSTLCKICAYSCLLVSASQNLFLVETHADCSDFEGVSWSADSSATWLSSQQLFQANNKEYTKLKGIKQCQVNFFRRGPVMLELYPCHDAIVEYAGFLISGC